MPIYEYVAVEGGCEYCRKRFEVLQSMGAEPLRNCPRCGAPVRKVPSRVTVVKDVLSPSNLRDKGFTKLVRKDKGVYEKVT